MIKIYAYKDVLNILINELELINDHPEERKEKYHTFVGDYYKELSKCNRHLKKKNEIAFEFYEYDDILRKKDFYLMMYALTEKDLY